MQTDPNWSNFLYEPRSGQLSLIDFGACQQHGRLESGASPWWRQHRTSPLGFLCGLRVRLHIRERSLGHPASPGGAMPPTWEPLPGEDSRLGWYPQAVRARVRRQLPAARARVCRRLRRARRHRAPLARARLPHRRGATATTPLARHHPTCRRYNPLARHRLMYRTSATLPEPKPKLNRHPRPRPKPKPKPKPSPSPSLSRNPTPNRTLPYQATSRR